jgi:hypothetical protein
VQRDAHAQTWQELVDGKWQATAQQARPFKPQLQQHFQQGATNASALHSLAQGNHRQGDVASDALVRDDLEQTGVRPTRSPATTTVWQVTGCSPTPRPPHRRRAPGLQAILERCPELQAAADHVRVFGEMLTHLRGQQLPAWIAAVRADADDLPGLGSFAAGLERDLDAVTRGLTTRWNSGPIEGWVNHIKIVKRQRFGRAGLPLLRKRVLLTAARR